MTKIQHFISRINLFLNVYTVNHVTVVMDLAELSELTLNLKSDVTMLNIKMYFQTYFFRPFFLHFTNFKKIVVKIEFFKYVLNKN